MAKTGLHIETEQGYIAVKVGGMPISRYAPQIFQLLTQHGLDAAREMLARPIMSDRGITLQWFAQTSIPSITPWRQATLSQQINCLAQLIEMANAIAALRRKLAGLSVPSLTIIDQILQNLTVIPSTEAIFLAGRQPLLVQWGYYSEERTAVDLPSLHHQLQQQFAKESVALEYQCPEAVESSHSTFRYRYYLAAAVAVLVIAGAITISRPVSKPPLVSLSPIILTQDDVKMSIEGILTASRDLPVNSAELIIPPPESKPTRVIKSKVPLMIPALSRYQGNINFLKGTWLTTLHLNDKLSTVSYRFNHGRASTRIANDHRYCTTTSQAAFTSTGKLVISTLKAHCSDGSTLPVITLICEKSAPNTQCRWKQNASTTQPIKLYSERDL